MTSSESIEVKQSNYTDEMQSLFSGGPYHLAGHSMGGWIAYAVAQELTSHGAKVAFLGLVDTQASSNVGWRVFLKAMLPVLWDRGVYHVNRAWKLPWSESWNYLANRWKWLMMHLPGTHRELPSDNGNFASTPNLTTGRMIDYFDAVATVYRPEPFTGDAVVFAGVDQSTFQHAKFWRSFIQGRVDFHRVGGDHMSLIGKEHAAEIAILFRKYLDTADQQMPS